MGTILGGVAGFFTVWLHYQLISAPYEGEALSCRCVACAITATSYTLHEAHETSEVTVVHGPNLPVSVPLTSLTYTVKQ